MRLASFSFTQLGNKLGEKISKIQNTKYNIAHFNNSNIHGGIKKYIDSHWNEYDGFIFISATGIAVRIINPYIESKTRDPAVVVVDDMGQFVISLLSGHIGSANDISKWLAKEIDAIPVITTASDNRGMDAVDVFAKRNNYLIEDMKSAKEITSLMVNWKKIGLYTEDENRINYENIEIIKDVNSIEANIDGLIIVTSKEDLGEINIPYTILRPKNINIGIGCRKGIDSEIVIEAIDAALKEKHLSPKCIKTLGTVEVKKFEIGIIKAAEHFNCPIKIFTLKDLLPIEEKFQKSQFVKDTIGVYSVSEPCAYLLGEELITRKSRFNGVTISISK
ncbi:MAG: cobalt-precorrin 5A hydrolase [Tissierellia bacterium]|nr:cobalt-precorrin 5A hydrolase [Tissierellia bacterium]MDD4726313.1 cobalt-precorrin 5A hydrolase [Tissierellia bacterium]